MAKPAKNKKPVAKTGRPSKYQPCMCEKVVKCMAEGYSIEETAAEIGIRKSTLYEYAKIYPEFSDALKEGEELSKAWWLAKGRVHLENKDFNSGLWFMNMKNRHGWADKKNLEHTGKDGGPIAQQWTGGPPPMTIEDWERQVKQAEAAQADEDAED